MRLAVIGVPYNSAGEVGGEALAPGALRAAGLVLRMAEVADTIDVGDVCFVPPTPRRDAQTGITSPRTLLQMVTAVRAAVGEAIAAGRLPIVVGGECPLLLGCLAAARDAHERVGLVFVDGHEDAYPPHASLSGEAADMELGIALGFSSVDGLEDIASPVPLIRPDDVVVLGARDRRELAGEGVPTIADRVSVRDDHTLLGDDLTALVRADTTQIHASAGPWWLHLDLDVLSSEALAAVRYPQPGGLDWNDLRTLTDAALSVPGLVGIDLTIYNPDLDPDRSGAARIVDFMEATARLLAGRET